MGTALGHSLYRYTLCLSIACIFLGRTTKDPARGEENHKSLEWHILVPRFGCWNPSCVGNSPIFLGSIIVSGKHLYFGTTFPKHPRFICFAGKKHTSVRNMASWKISEVNGHLNGEIIYKWWVFQKTSIAVLHVTQGLRQASTITTTNIIQY